MLDKIRVIISFAANIKIEANNDCIPIGNAVSDMIMNSTNDAITPYNSGWPVVGANSARRELHSTK